MLIFPEKLSYKARLRQGQVQFAARGRKSDISDEEILENLLSLNLERAR